MLILLAFSQASVFLVTLRFMLSSFHALNQRSSTKHWTKIRISRHIEKTFVPEMVYIVILEHFRATSHCFQLTWWFTLYAPNRVDLLTAKVVSSINTANTNCDGYIIQNRDKGGNISERIIHTDHVTVPAIIVSASSWSRDVLIIRSGCDCKMAHVTYWVDFDSTGLHKSMYTVIRVLRS